MNLHEYQGKTLFREYGLPVSNGIACDTTDDVLAAAKEIGGDAWVVKAQVHAGGRGKAGGVKLVKTDTGDPGVLRPPYRYPPSNLPNRRKRPACLENIY